MRRSLTLLATVGLLIGLVPVAALATPPEVDEGGFGFRVLQEDMSERCGTDIYITVEGRYRVTVFFDKHGEPIRERIHETGEVLWTSVDGEVWENYAVNVDIDYAAGTETVKGNVWNIHAGAGGILVNDSGRIVLVPDGKGGYEGALTVNGPHQAWYEEFDDLCAALS